MSNFEMSASTKTQREDTSTMHGLWSEPEMNKALQRDNKVQTDEHLKRQTNSHTECHITWLCNIRVVVLFDKTEAFRRIIKDRIIG